MTLIRILFWGWGGGGLVGKQSLMPFTRKGLTQELKAFKHTRGANFICKGFEQISDEILLCPEYTRSSITGTVCRNAAFGMEFAPQ